MRGCTYARSSQHVQAQRTYQIQLFIRVDLGGPIQVVQHCFLFQRGFGRHCTNLTCQFNFDSSNKKALFAMVSLSAAVPQCFVLLLDHVRLLGWMQGVVKRGSLFLIRVPPCRFSRRCPSARLWGKRERCGRERVDIPRNENDPTNWEISKEKTPAVLGLSGHGAVECG